MRFGWSLSQHLVFKIVCELVFHNIWHPVADSLPYEYSFLYSPEMRSASVQGDSGSKPGAWIFGYKATEGYWRTSPVNRMLRPMYRGLRIRDYLGAMVFKTETHTLALLFTIPVNYACHY